MVSRKVVFFVLFTAIGISVMLLYYTGVKRYGGTPVQPLDDQGYGSHETMRQRKVPKRHTKMTVPAEVSLGLADASNPGRPVSILVTASSQIPVGSGTLTLKVPPVGEISAEKLVLWSGTPSDFVAESVEYVVDSLPVGEYRFAAIFEFTPDREDAEKLFASKSLYLDVRPDKILSSNVSFDQIKRIELWEELEQRVLTKIRTSSRSISLQAAKPLDKDFIASRIAELKASDPDVARRIMELNQVKTAPAEESESEEQVEGSQPNMMLRSVHNQPVMEREVPIPDRYRDK